MDAVNVCAQASNIEQRLLFALHLVRLLRKISKSQWPHSRDTPTVVVLIIPYRLGCAWMLSHLMSKLRIIVRKSLNAPHTFILTDNKILYHNVTHTRKRRFIYTQCKTNIHSPFQ